MLPARFSAGLILPQPRLPDPADPVATELTVEAAVQPAPGETLRVELLVTEDAEVAQGQPLMRLKTAPGIALVAPMAARVARIDLQPGRRLSQLVLFHEAGGARHAFDTRGAEGDPARLRALLQDSGLWRMIRSRPFGRMPAPDEAPAAILVMGRDTRPGAPDPALAVKGREEDLARGLSALASLTAGPLLYAGPGAPAPARPIATGPLHPQGLAGPLLHRHFPARTGAPVWDLTAEDAADIGALLATGFLPPTRLIAITGEALRSPALVRCQPGADLRGLTRARVLPGPHDLLSGSALDGRPALWLGSRDRQVTALPRAQRPAGRHWFRAALDRAARHAPIIPTAALDQALGGDLPAAALVRALAAGDAEGLIRLGGLSLLEEDLALADYATGSDQRLARQLRALLDRIAAEEGLA